MIKCMKVNKIWNLFGGRIHNAEVIVGVSCMCHILPAYTIRQYRTVLIAYAATKQLQNFVNIYRFYHMILYVYLIVILIV